MKLEQLRSEVLQTALDLAKFGLVWMAGGTACARDPHSGLVVMTPSGLAYDTLQPEDMVLLKWWKGIISLPAPANCGCVSSADGRT